MNNFFFIIAEQELHNQVARVPFLQEPVTHSPMPLLFQSQFKRKISTELNCHEVLWQVHP